MPRKKVPEAPPAPTASPTRGRAGKTTTKKTRKKGGKTPDNKPRRLTGTTPEQQKAIARRDELRGILERSGYAGLDVYAFARKHAVHHSTIYNDLKMLGRNVGEERGEQLVSAVLARLAKAESVFLSVADGEDDKARVSAGKALVDMSKLEVELLDLLGIKRASLQGDEDRPIVHKVMAFDPAGYPAPGGKSKTQHSEDAE